MNPLPNHACRPVAEASGPCRRVARALTTRVVMALASLALGACALAVIDLPGSTAMAQTWPSRPVKLVVPSSPGGATDTLSRALSTRLPEIWGQAVIVENRPGANQIIGGDYVSKAAPDGYTLLVSDAATFVINPFLYKSLPYDPIGGFAPVTQLVQVPWVIGVNAAGVPARTIPELIALAKAKPGSLSWGTFGNGSSAHIGLEWFKRLAGVDIVHVPYKGSAPAASALLTGEISMMMVTPLVLEQHVRSGRLRLIAAATEQRLPLLPNLPTVGEQGVPGYVVGTWFGMLAPAGTPADIVSKIAADVAKVMSEPAFREQNVTGQWLIPVANTPQEFSAFLRRDYEYWKKMVETSGVKLD